MYIFRHVWTIVTSILLTLHIPKAILTRIAVCYSYQKTCAGVSFKRIIKTTHKCDIFLILCKSKQISIAIKLSQFFWHQNEFRLVPNEPKNVITIQIWLDLRRFSKRFLRVQLEQNSYDRCALKF